MNDDMFGPRKGCLSRGNSLCKGPGARGGTLAYSGKSQKANVAGMLAQRKLAQDEVRGQGSEPPHPRRTGGRARSRRFSQPMGGRWISLVHSRKSTRALCGEGKEAYLLHWTAWGTHILQNQHHRAPGELSNLEEERSPRNGWSIKTMTTPILMTVKGRGLQCTQPTAPASQGPLLSVSRRGWGPLTGDQAPRG